ncbi:MAG: alkaline phosphatase family protein [Pseudarcicella sp.]|nr:alkaline phosphatase family protein [Pseudarcicella sp.]MBP6409972.1 alkaline phosphatase family protein [Pseudarcicella sp.]
MKNIITFILLFFLFVDKNLAQTNPKFSQPKLVVGIVVDQMRYDYLEKFKNKFSQNGFLKLQKQGFECKNNYYNYAPTVTAAGHAAIFTGSIPAINGIVGNDWFDKFTQSNMYCVEDSSVKTIGAPGNAGKMSPKNLLVNTIADQLKLSNEFQSKSIGISLKDRGAILPAGHSADAAYWFDSKTGNWISSSYYLEKLPDWVDKFNAQKLPSSYIQKGWNTLFDINTYQGVANDDNSFETKLAGETKTSFPHILAASSGKNLFESIRTSPFGNSLTKDFAIATLQNESLGKGKYTDFLSVSFSSTDYVGHAFGPNSVEIEDTYLRLDKDIADLIVALENQVGKNNFLLFLTADHGVSEIPSYLKKHKQPSGSVEMPKVLRMLKDSLVQHFQVKDLIWAEENNQLYIDFQRLKYNKIAYQDFFDFVNSVLMKEEFITNVVDLHNLSNSNLTDYQLAYIKNGYQPKRSGDIMILFAPNRLTGYKTGTGHSSFYRYDTHVPLLFYGTNVEAGFTNNTTFISDIASTTAALLGIQEPNGAIGNVIFQSSKLKTVVK